MSMKASFSFAENGFKNLLKQIHCSMEYQESVVLI